jgi:hypothetical protein
MHDAYRGDGAGGQFVVILPRQDAVVVITASTGNTQVELNAICDHAFPAFAAPLLPSDAAATTTIVRVCSIIASVLHSIRVPTADGE